PREARVDRAEDGLARQAPAVGPLAPAEEHLRRDHHLVAPREIPQRPPEDLLAGAVGIAVGGVEEVDPRLDRAADERARIGLRQRPRMAAPVRVAVGHAAEAEPRYVESRASELGVFHAAHYAVEPAGLRRSVTIDPWKPCSRPND